MDASTVTDALNQVQISADSSFSVTFPKSPGFELACIGAELFQSMEEHDVLVMQFKGKPYLPETVIASGDPVVFTFNSGKTPYSWYGYVHTISQDNTSKVNNTEITCVSCSYLLKNTDQKIYKNVTADQVVSKISKKNGLSATTERHPRVRASIVQAGQTDWQILRRLAKQTGFSLRVENTNIVFMSKDRIFNIKKKYAPYFGYIDSEVTGVVTMADRSLGTILSFYPLISDESPELGVKVNRVISGTNVTTGTTMSVVIPASTVSTSSVASKVVPSKEYFQ